MYRKLEAFHALNPHTSIEFNGKSHRIAVEKLSRQLQAVVEELKRV